MHGFGALRCQPKGGDPGGPRGETDKGQFTEKEIAAAADRHRYFTLQPIFSHAKRVVGCEALFRKGWDHHFDGDSDAATRIMIDNWLLYGFEDLSGANLTFLNCTREVLLSGLLTLLPRWAVFEILETVEPDEEVIRACRQLKKLGYLISLDDFESIEGMEDFVELADFIKIDFRITGAGEREHLLMRLKRTKAILIAEKVETEEEFQLARWEGFHLFQGFYFQERSSFAMTRDPLGTENCLRILEILNETGFAIGGLADLICREPGIGCRLLRRANWETPEGAPVNTFRDALKLIGKNEFRKLVMLAMLADLKSWNDLPPEFAPYGNLANLGMRTGDEPSWEQTARVLHPLRNEAKPAAGGKILKMPSSSRTARSKPPKS